MAFKLQSEIFFLRISNIKCSNIILFKVKQDSPWHGLGTEKRLTELITEYSWEKLAKLGGRGRWMESVRDGDERSGVGCGF